MKLYLKMAVLSAVISLAFSACERIGQQNSQLGQQVVAIHTPAR